MRYTKYLALLLAALLVLSALAGCETLPSATDQDLTKESESSAIMKEGDLPENLTELDLSGFQAQDGHFRPKGTDWFTPIDQLEQQLGELLGEFRSKDTAAEKLRGSYFTADAVSWDGCPGYIRHDIASGFLVAVVYGFIDTSTDLDGLFDSLAAKLTELYGEPWYSDEKSLQWRTENEDESADFLASKINVLKNLTGETRTISVMLNVIPWDPMEIWG